MENRIRVVLTAEGTYPYSAGGVSTWAHILIEELKEVDFTLLPIKMNPFLKMKFTLPKNVVDIITVPLWGILDPSEFTKEISFSDIYRAKLKSKQAKLQKKFIPILNTIIDYIYEREKDLDYLGDVLVDFHNYFDEFDYHEIFVSDEIWQAYKKKMGQIHLDCDQDIPTVSDLVEGLRFLYRFFITLLPPIKKAEVYHSSAAAFCGLPCILAKKKFGSKFLLTEHGIYIREQYLFASREKIPLRTKEFLMGLITLVSKLNYVYADVISPVCNYNQRWELQWGAKKEQLKTIYNGIDVDRFKPMKEYRIDKNPTVVMLARIDPLKDIETYINTCHLVAKKIPNVLFKLFGHSTSAEYYEKCKSLVKKLKVEKNFSFEGATSNAPAAYNQGDVVMLTSISEAFPFAVIEGMACEKIVISSDVGGTAEVLKDYGYIVKPKAYEEFAKHTIDILNNLPKYREMEIEARQKILNRFTVEDMVDNYYDTYSELFQQFQKENPIQHDRTKQI